MSSALIPATLLVPDQQGWITIVAGLLLALITLFTSYSHVDLPILGAIRINQQTGIPLLVASLATLVVEVQLASRRRSRAADRAAEERNRAAEERNRAAAERERALRRAQCQNRCTLVQLRHQLSPTTAHAQQVANLISLLEEYADLT